MSIVAANGIRICGRYTLLGRLGEGGEGEVWRARDHEQGKEVALKILRPDIAVQPGVWEALEREHEISRRLDHPLILKVDRPVRDAETVALPMELAPDGDLRRLCGVSYLEIVPVLMEVAQALAHAHERGIVHRDLKASNILFDARGHVRVADFGGTRTGLSPFSASPQQLRGEPPAAADDIYGLGALAYELLSGHPPYHPRFELRRVLEEPVPPLKPAHLAPGRLVSLVMSMLSKQASARPASMRDVSEALDGGLNDTLPFTFDEAPDALSSSVDTLPLVRRPAGDDAADAPLPVRTPAPAVPVPAPTGTEPPHLSAHVARGSAAALPQHVTPSVAQAGAPVEPRAAQSPAPAGAAAMGGRAPAEPEAAGLAPLRADRRAPEADLRALWADIKVERVPNLMKLEPIRRSRWPWTLAAGIAAAAVVVFLLLHSAVNGGSWTPPSVAQLRAMAPPQLVRALRGAVEVPLQAMARRQQQAQSAARSRSAPDGSSSTPGTAQPAPETPAQGSPVSPGRVPPVASSEGSSAAEPVQSSELQARRHHLVARQAATDVRSATTERMRDERIRSERVHAASRMRNPIAGGTAPDVSGPGYAGNGAVAAADDIRSRASGAPALRALLRDGREAETAHEYSRAAQDYSQALELDAGNAAARAGLRRANAAFGAGQYAQAVGAGFAALGAGRLDEAQTDFARARSLDHRGREAKNGLRRVAAAMRARDAAEARSRARSDLENRLQALIDDPQSLAAPATRAEAASLLREAGAVAPSGSVLKSLARQLEVLLPSYDKPVHLALVSDNETQVAIPQIGSFGTFARRDIDLKPGHYIIIGTRAGYQEVRRDVTVMPGPTVQTISIRCEEPI